MIDPGLEGKVVLITGANHGIGEAAARAFANQGARAFLTCFREPVVCSDEALEDARKAGGEVAHPPMEIPAHGTFAIYIQGGIHHGLWQL